MPKPSKRLAAGAVSILSAVCLATAGAYAQTTNSSGNGNNGSTQPNQTNATNAAPGTVSGNSSGNGGTDNSAGTNGNGQATNGTSSSGTNGNSNTGTSNNNGAGQTNQNNQNQDFEANINEVNHSGAHGTLTVKLSGDQAKINEHVSGLLANQPHAQHLHYDAQATHTCPSQPSGNGIVSGVDAQPDVGTVAVSLTTKGSTGPGAALNFKDYPTAKNGNINYSRTVTLTNAQAQALRNGQMVVEIHGIDVDHNGKYDTSAGTSPLAQQAGLGNNVPLEETAPAACGVLTAQLTSNESGNSSSGNGNKAALDAALGLGSFSTLLSLINFFRRPRRVRP